MDNRMNVVLTVVALIMAVLSLALGVALRTAQVDRKAAEDTAQHWKQVASKAYTGYLLAMSPAGDDGLTHLQVPKDARHEDGRLLPPDDFCEKGLLQCRPFNNFNKGN